MKCIQYIGFIYKNNMFDAFPYFAKLLYVSFILVLGILKKIELKQKKVHQECTYLVFSYDANVFKLHTHLFHPSGTF